MNEFVNLTKRDLLYVVTVYFIVLKALRFYLTVSSADQKLSK